MGCQLCGAKYSKTVQTYEHPANPSSSFTGSDGRGTGGFWQQAPPLSVIAMLQQLSLRLRVPDNQPRFPDARFRTRAF